MAHTAHPPEGHGTIPDIQRNGRAGKFDSDVREPDYPRLVNRGGDPSKLRAGHTGGYGMVKAIKAAVVTARDYSRESKVATGIIMALLAGAITVGVALLNKVSEVDSKLSGVAATVESDSAAVKELRDRVLQHQIYGPHPAE